MSKKTLQKALEAKGLSADLDYRRSVPTPSGFAKGWDIYLTESSENKLFNADFQGEYTPDCETVGEALAWIETLPSCA